MRVPPAFVVEFSDAAAVRPLRHEVLRPGRPGAEADFDGDDDPRAGHVVVRAPEGRLPPEGDDVVQGATNEVLAVGSVMPAAPPWEPGRTDGWRIRGMATRPSARGQGLGRAVLEALAGHVARHGGGLLWCNARTGALGLYEGAGFTGRGEAFDIPGIGPHLQMWRNVAAGRS